MKNVIVKAVVACTLALSLLFVGVDSVGVADASVCDAGYLGGEYDGPYDSEYVY